MSTHIPEVYPYMAILQLTPNHNPRLTNTSACAIFSQYS